MRRQDTHPDNRTQKQTPTHKHTRTNTHAHTHAHLPSEMLTFEVTVQLWSTDIAHAKCPGKYTTVITGAVSTIKMCDSNKSVVKHSPYQTGHAITSLECESCSCFGLIVCSFYVSNFATHIHVCTNVRPMQSICQLSIKHPRIFVNDTKWFLFSFFFYRSGKKETRNFNQEVIEWKALIPISNWHMLPYRDRLLPLKMGATHVTWCVFLHSTPIPCWKWTGLICIVWSLSSQAATDKSVPTSACLFPQKTNWSVGVGLVVGGWWWYVNPCQAHTSKANTVEIDRRHTCGCFSLPLNQAANHCWATANGSDLQSLISLDNRGVWMLRRLFHGRFGRGSLHNCHSHYGELAALLAGKRLSACHLTKITSK